MSKNVGRFIDSINKSTRTVNKIIFGGFASGTCTPKIFLLLYISECNALHIILQYKFLKKHATEVLI